MLDTIKTICCNTPIVNILFIVLFNGIYTRHIIKKFSEENNYTKNELESILKKLDMNLTDDEIKNYLSNVKK
jgi:hypothetical protein